MKSSPENKSEHRAMGTLAAVARALAGAMALMLATAISALGYTTYSGASVGSNGTIYSWGVTDATSGWYMPHTAYIRTTLTSPRGRMATSGRISGPNVIRADVYLPWDPTDLGTYSVWSYHDFYCVIIGAVNLGSSQGSANESQVPTKLSLVSTISQGPASCGQSAAGWERWVRWQVLDQFTPAHPIQRAMPVSDTITIGSPNTCGASSWTGSYTTDSSGRFPDYYFMCSTACVGGTCQSNASQRWTVDGYVLVSDIKSVVYMCNSITINGQ